MWCMCLPNFVAVHETACRGCFVEIFEGALLSNFSTPMAKPDVLCSEGNSYALWIWILVQIAPCTVVSISFINLEHPHWQCCHRNPIWQKITVASAKSWGWGLGWSGQPSKRNTWKYKNMSFPVANRWCYYTDVFRFRQLHVQWNYNDFLLDGRTSKS